MDEQHSARDVAQSDLVAQPPLNFTRHLLQGVHEMHFDERHGSR